MFIVLIVWALVIAQNSTDIGQPCDSGIACQKDELLVCQDSKWAFKLSCQNCTLDQAQTEICYLGIDQEKASGNTSGIPTAHQLSLGLHLTVAAVVLVIMGVVYVLWRKYTLDPATDDLGTEKYTCIMEFDPRGADEIQLEFGDKVNLHVRLSDGWAKVFLIHKQGTNETKNRYGSFPIVCLGEIPKKGEHV